MDRQIRESSALLIGIDVEALLRTAVNGRRVVALAGTHHRFLGRLEVGENAARADDGWLPATIVMCPHILGPREDLDDSTADAAIDASLADGTTRRVQTKVRLHMGDNYDSFVALAVPRLGGKQHGLSGWTCYSPAEVRWHLHRDRHVSLHLMTVADVIEDIRANAQVLVSRLRNPEDREKALPQARDLAGRVVRVFGEAIKTVGQWGSRLEARHHTYHYGRRGDIFGADAYDVCLSYYSRHNPEADEVIWATDISESWTPDVGIAPPESLTVYAAEDIVGELAHGVILDDIAGHLDSLAPIESISKAGPFEAVFPLGAEYYAARAQELRDALAKAHHDHAHERAVCKAVQFVVAMNGRLIRLIDIAGVNGQLGRGFKPWSTGEGRRGKDEGAVRRLYQATAFNYTVWVPEISEGWTTCAYTPTHAETHVRGALDILRDLSSASTLRGIQYDAERDPERGARRSDLLDWE